VIRERAPGTGSGTLADAVGAVRPFLPECLVPSADADRIGAIAALLPGPLATGVGFECHLGEQPPHADFFVRIKAAEVGRDVLAGRSRSGSLPAVLAEHPVWARLSRVSRDWADPEHVLHRSIDNVWLEFDVGPADEAVPLPSVFFGAWGGISSRILTGAGTEEQAYGWLTQEALARMLARPLSAGTAEVLHGALDALPVGANVFQVGVMLARDTEAVRLCIVDLPTDQVSAYLAGLGWIGNTAELTALMHRLATNVDRLMLHVDVGRRVFDKIGIECYMDDYRQPGDEPRWGRFLGQLVETGICRADQREALLAYPGYARNDFGQAPRHVAAVSFLLGSRAASGLARVLHHVKVAYRPGHPLEAKAYLGAVQHWLVAGAVQI
jgi:hypothetical protein